MVDINKTMRGLTLIASFLYFFEYTIYGQTISGTKYIVMLLIVFLVFIKDRNEFFCFHQSYSVLFIFISFVLIPVMQAIINASIGIAMYLVVMLVFLIATYHIGNMINTDKKLMWFVTSFSVIGTIVITVCFLLNYSNMFNVSGILSNFTTELSNTNISLELSRRERSEFGFMHVNSLGGICLAVVVGLTMTEPEKKIMKTLRIIAIVFLLLIVLNTGSRASIYGILGYFLALGAEKLYYRSSVVFKFILKILLAILAVYILAIVFLAITNNFDFVNRLTSYRLEGWIYDIKKMKNDGTLLFGYGMYNPTAFFSQPFSSGMIVDNWYVYMIVNIGFVGFASCILLIITFFRKLLQKCTYDQNGMALKVLALFVANLFHAMAEKAFITPADPISYFMLVVMFAEICREEKVEYMFIEGEFER